MIDNCTRQWKYGVGFLTVSFLLTTACNWPPGGTGSGTGGTSGGGTSGGSTATPSVSASLLEQLALERINRARLKPAAEATAAGIAIDEGIPGLLNTTPKQPIALNEQLNTAATAHSQDMLDQNYFAHDTPGGVTPFDRITSAGYVFTSAGENLAWRGTTGALDQAATIELQHDDLFVDSGVADRGHRVTMLNNTYREVGIGILQGNYTQSGTLFDSLMQTQDYGLSTSNNTFVLGVVYNDANSNGQYDYGEGVASTTVTLGSTAKATNTGGGYSFEVITAGTYTLSFDGGPSQSILITDGAPNIKIDYVSSATLVVNLGVGALP